MAPWYQPSTQGITPRQSKCMCVGWVGVWVWVDVWVGVGVLCVYCMCVGLGGCVHGGGDIQEFNNFSSLSD